MIHIDKIRALKTLFVHAYPDNPCPDGLAAALIVRDALPSIEVRFLVHGTREFEELVAGLGMLFCDIIPPAARAAEFVEAGAIVLDHHATARPIVEMFGELGVYADACSEPGVSGAVLAFREIWLPIKESELPPGFDMSCSRTRARHLDDRNRISRFAMLTGVRDTWQRTSPHWREACEQMAALMFYPDWLPTSEPRSGEKRGGSLFEEGGDFDARMAIGKTLLLKAEAETAALVKQALTYTTTLASPDLHKGPPRSGTRIAILPSCRISDAANLIDADVVVGFQFTASDTEPPAMRVSLRSRGDYDVSKLAATFKGGGGHKGAAGMSIPVHSSMTHPYLTIREVIARYENSVETPWGVVREKSTAEQIKAWQPPQTPIRFEDIIAPPETLELIAEGYRRGLFDNQRIRREERRLQEERARSEDVVFVREEDLREARRREEGLEAAEKLRIKLLRSATYGKMDMTEEELRTQAAAIETTPPLVRANNDDRIDPANGPVLVTIHYFKPQSGKWGYTDEGIEWPPDPSDYTGWKEFKEIRRLPEFTAVCIDTPLGFPVCHPSKVIW